ncbi:hypothetical protein ABEB36_000732 [Hypothenemus hampei]|uniref:Lariat debranching enzyme C-terminal domain-containing protein n=1 Tax=Hypothenemus hampei TaxID=57062 RepID=A0ABD1FFI3_HYPHA
MKIAVEGCAHGELEVIYETIKNLEKKEQIKVDLLICCGDFQSSRNLADLRCMAVPAKYRKICTFHKYYSGEKKAPILTIFIGGNHEASNYLQELPYGGWVAPNIYYLGYAGVVNVAGIRIAGISGIYKSRDYLKGRYEKAPFDEDGKRSVYHIRNLDVFRLKQLTQPIDIFLSHDWPTGICNYGNVEKLLKTKPYFRDDIEQNQLGSRPCEELLKQVQPNYWFAAHLHCKFAALVPHENGPSTKFLALDKCLPKRKFLQILDIPHEDEKPIHIEYDLEWLTILFLTNHLLSVKNAITYMPGPGGDTRYDFRPNETEKELVFNKLGNNLKVPENFRPTATSYKSTVEENSQPHAKLNPQTVELCEVLGIDDPIGLISVNLTVDMDSSQLESSTFIDTDLSSSSHKELEDNLEEEDHSDVVQVKKLSPIKLPKPVHELEDVKLDEANTISSLSSSQDIQIEQDLKSSKPLLESESEGSSVQDISTEENSTTFNLKNTVDDANDGEKSLIKLKKQSPKRPAEDEECPTKSIEGQNDENITKTFKRRNASIYNSEN